MRAYTLTLEVSTDPANPYLHVLEARTRGEAIMLAERILDMAPATLVWTSAILRNENGAVVWQETRDPAFY